MSVHLGGKLRRLTNKAKQLGYVKEYEQVWEHRCEPPRDRHLHGGYPILSGGEPAEIETQWQCSCGKVWEVYVPLQRYPGRRDWKSAL